MKKLLLILFSFIPIFLSAQDIIEQKNAYYLSLNISKLTTGDQNGFHIKNEYNRMIFKNFYMGFSLGYLHSAVQSSLLSMDVPPDFDNNIATGDWGYSSEDGIKILETRTNQQTYIHTDITVGYKVVNLGAFSLRLNAGGSFAYINNTFITRWELGTFNGFISGETNLQLVYPYYSRLLDIGIVARLDIVYDLNDTFVIGLSAGGNDYLKSGYRFYDLGINLGLKF